MIRLGRLTDYAVVLLAQMAREEMRVWSASELATITHLPQPTVAKVLKQLTKAHVITAQRGMAGGYKLANSPHDITILSIVEVMDGPIAITDCADGGDHSCAVERLCPLQSGWNIVNTTIRGALIQVTLASMIGARKGMGGHL